MGVYNELATRLREELPDHERLVRRVQRDSVVEL
jgi:hypothetical protein